MGLPALPVEYLLLFVWVFSFLSPAHVSRIIRRRDSCFEHPDSIVTAPGHPVAFKTLHGRSFLMCPQ